MKIRKMPTLRDKKRYIYFTVHSKSPLSYTDLRNSIFNSILNFLGEETAARANPTIVRNLWNEKKFTGVIRCTHKYVDPVKVSLCLIHQIGDEPVIIQATKVSGTIKGLGLKNSED